MRSSSSSLLLNVHSSPQSNHEVSLHPNANANEDITIGFIYASDDSVPSAVPSYSYCVTSSLKNYSKSSPPSRRWARTPRRIARRRRRSNNRHRTPQRSVSRTSPTPRVDGARYYIRHSSQKVNAVYRTRDAVRRSINLSNVEPFDYAAFIGFEQFDSPTDSALHTYYC